MDENILRLKEIIENSQKIVFFTGAGVSTESGIPDFRSVDGLYNQTYDYSPEEILSHHFYQNNPKEFYRFYRDKMIYENAQPNDAHKVMAQLEKDGKSLGVVTQNIDGLHQMAGSQHVYELHGSIHRNYCEKCHRFYALDSIKTTKGVPHCECGGIIKPDVVLYEESLDSDVINQAVTAIYHADTLIVAGTSLSVYPASGFVHYFRGNNLVLINLSATAYDNQADLLIRGKVGEILSLVYNYQVG